MDDGAHNSLLFLSEKETDPDFFLSCAWTRLHTSRKKRLTTLVEFVVCRLEREREGMGKLFCEENWPNDVIKHHHKSYDLWTRHLLNT